MHLWTLPQQQAAQELADSVVTDTLQKEDDANVVFEEAQQHHSPQQQQQYYYPQHRNLKISRPTAAKISGAMDTTTATTATTNDVTATATTTKLLHPTEDHHPKADIFSSQGSIDMSTFKDIIFSSHIDTNDDDADDDDELGAAVAAILTEEDLVNRSCDTTATTSGESSTLDGGDDEHELGEFLWDALAGFDPTVNDLADLCQTN